MAEGAAEEAPADGGGDSAASAPDRGVAPIKPQYLTTKEQFHEFLEARGEEKFAQETEAVEPESHDLAEPEAKRVRLADGQVEDGQTVAGQTEEASELLEQPQAQKRARGQNKSRPHLKPTHYDGNRLCPSLIQGSASKCFFGDRCRFLHDVGRYLETKPADLGPCCVLFETFGRCPYGVTCRFAGAHLGPEGQNLVREELAAQGAHTLPVRNTLDKTLQQQLRKRKVRFERAEWALLQLSQGQPLGPVSTAAATPEAAAAEGAPGQGHGDAQQALPGPDATALPSSPVKTCGPLTDEDVIKLRPCEKKRLDIGGKLYLAPLTTCGNLPFRRICKRFGADVTCGEMAVCTNLLQGQTSEWALLKRHHSEDLFGVQLEGAFPDTMTRCAELLNRTIEVDFVDINVGCPIDLVYKKVAAPGPGVRGRRLCPHEPLHQVPADCPWHEPGAGRATDGEDPHRCPGAGQPSPSPAARAAGLGCGTRHVCLSRSPSVTLPLWLLPPQLHGRSREQRYTKMADWQYIEQCVRAASPMPLFGNGDILSYEDANRAMQTGVAGVMIARGALLKPWLFTEIKEQRHWDISSSERLDILRDFTHYGLEHWGSDTQGVEKTRRFLLEWLSFLCRYVPVGLLERLPQKINERPPYYLGRNYLETLMASQNSADWVRISEMLLGPVPPNFVFLPKHKANSYK
ncbi:tRNA-dihydrouridine(47) synthase [NAD(P)(+)]-like isoform X3 [Elephas maximus indicus]|uniref:tRNA-dihydrouridine(47) synthase [NAD(P)(+)]-like isoform X3 n=1 Tax=Elephas maximus indicus TaxID=99487 RepID=UPI0021162577|nr:tRNA-dihydrouridine(47) synthase [NAD(P)(+)]-like isoform X3 [Elephas maximus indicus]